MRVPILALIGTVLTAVPAAAHHLFSAEFDANAPVRLTGTVMEVVWSNPHVVIHMTASGANENRSWTVEAASPADLTRKGWSRETLKSGDQITVEGFRAKSEPTTASARVIELPGGKKMSASDDQDGGPKIPLP